MSHNNSRAKPLRFLLVAAVLVAGFALAPAASSTAVGTAPVNTAQTELSTRASSIPSRRKFKKAFRQGFRRGVRHYNSPLWRLSGPVHGPGQVARWDWDWVPNWITNAAREAKWWLSKTFKCGLGVAAFFAFGAPAKIAVAVRKINRLSRTDRHVRKARRAIRRLGGVKGAMRVVGRFAKSRGGGVTPAQKRRLRILVTSGGAVVANILGVSSCFAIAKKIL